MKYTCTIIVEMYITTMLLHYVSFLYWYLAYICDGNYDMHIYVTVTSPYPYDQGIAIIEEIVWQDWNESNRSDMPKNQEFKTVSVDMKVLNWGRSASVSINK